jgi:hypothetical protein
MKRNWTSAPPKSVAPDPVLRYLQPRPTNETNMKHLSTAITWAATAPSAAYSDSINHIWMAVAIMAIGVLVTLSINGSKT